MVPHYDSTQDRISGEEWSIVQSSYDKELHGYYETIFALSNGYVGMRNTIEFDSEYTIPGTFFSEVYDNGIAVKTEIVNAPNWMELKIIIDDYSVNFDHVEILEFERVLDMKKGIVKVSVRFRDPYDHVTSIKLFYLLHHAHKHLALMYGSITPENYSAAAYIKSSLNYGYGNSYLGGYIQSIQTKHFRLVKARELRNGGILLNVRTLSSGINIVEASNVCLHCSSRRRIIFEKEKISELIKFDLRQDRTESFIKYATFYTSKDVKNPDKSCRHSLSRFMNDDFSLLKRRHYDAWEKKWNIADVLISGDRKAQKSIRFGIFHMIQATPESARVNIPARGLTSEYHSGHYFFNTDL